MILQWFKDRHARRAARYLQRLRIKREREHVRQIARELCIEAGRPIPKALAR